MYYRLRFSDTVSGQRWVYVDGYRRRGARLNFKGLLKKHLPPTMQKALKINRVELLVSTTYGKRKDGDADILSGVFNI